MSSRGLWMIQPSNFRHLSHEKQDMLAFRWMSTHGIKVAPTTFLTVCSLSTYNLITHTHPRTHTHPHKQSSSQPLSLSFIQFLSSTHSHLSCLRPSGCPNSMTQQRAVGTLRRQLHANRLIIHYDCTCCEHEGRFVSLGFNLFPMF